MFPSIGWDGDTFRNSGDDTAIAEAKGAALLAQSLVVVRQPSMFSFGIRSSEGDSADAATFFMPFISHWSSLPVTVTRRLEPSAKHSADVGVFEFDILAQCGVGDAVFAVWRHRVVLEEAPQRSALDVQVRLRLDEARDLFMSTCIEGVWSIETTIDTVCNALARPFSNAKAVSVVGVKGGAAPFPGPDTAVVRRGWCCKEESEILKQCGNMAFTEDRNVADDLHLTALEWYTLAVCFNPGNHILYSNRAASAQKLGLHALALSDSQASVRILPTFIKGLVRCGDASFCLGQFSEAVQYYKAALDAAPSTVINDKMLTAIAQRENAEADKKLASKKSENPRKKKKQGKGSNCVIT